MKHTILYVLLTSLIMTASSMMQAQSGLKNYSKQELNDIETLVDFDRENIIEAEGYWTGLAGDALHYPWPQPNALPWPGQEEFLQRLAFIESSPTTIKVRFRGLAYSRLEKDKLLGCSEYRIGSIRWTDAFGPYYVARFNVKPSREFYRFVMGYAVK